MNIKGINRSNKLERKKQRMPKHGTMLKNLEVFDSNPLTTKRKKDNDKKRNRNILERRNQKHQE